MESTLGFSTALLIVAALLGPGCTVGGSLHIGQAARIPIQVDHHVHLNSPAIQAFVPQYCRSVARFGPCDPALTKPHSPKTLLHAMNRAGIRRALLVSNGYLAQSTMVKPAHPDAGALLRAANDWTVAQSRRHPHRLAAFIAIDPMHPSALAEIERWRGNPLVTGLKLHLTAAGTDLRNKADLAALALVFRAADEARLTILIHLRTQRMDYGATDVRRFLADVLPAAGSSYVQVAHLGGWGQLDAATISALSAFADANEADRRSLAKVRFDLSGALTDATPYADRAMLAALISRIGPGHFLPGSDWPFTTDLGRLYKPEYPDIPLSASESQVIRSNVAPYAAVR